MMPVCLTVPESTSSIDEAVDFVEGFRVEILPHDVPGDPLVVRTPCRKKSSHSFHPSLFRGSVEAVVVQTTMPLEKQAEVKGRAHAVSASR